VVQGLSLHVEQGEIVTLMGRNGAGKTTTLRSLMGLVARTRGSILLEGKELLGQPAHLRYHLGMAYVPEDRRIVAGMTVHENLLLGLIASTAKVNVAEQIELVAQTFPRLKERLEQEATSLSGGEQQMLAIARALMAKPKLLLLDEPSEGIMPVMVDEMFDLFLRLKAAGTTILLVEQSVDRALAVSDRAYVIDQGAVVYAATARALLADPAIQERYCAV
jgi:branched-chain amino acid transport system ATP-binding protein